MTQYGSPPDPSQSHPPQPGPTQPGSGAPSAGGSETQPYNPYPQQWNQPEQVASPYGEPRPYGDATSYAQQQTPYGVPANPYGQPGAPGARANPYAGGTGRADRPTFGFGGYAGWWTRVGAYLIDSLLGSIAGLPLIVGYVMLFSSTTTTTDANGVKQLQFHPTMTIHLLVWLGILTSTAFTIWNVYIRQGRTGASYGKSVLAIRLVNSDLQPIGAGWAFLRQILHIVDSLPCGLGYLWPIWDSRKQTFADKIMSTFVIHATTQEPRPF